MQKIIIILCFFILTISTSWAGDKQTPFSGKSKQEYLELKEKTNSKKLMKAQATGNNAPAIDWGDCRDWCYDERNACFDAGTETYICETTYDSCSAMCDEEF